MRSWQTFSEALIKHAFLTDIPIVRNKTCVPDRHFPSCFLKTCEITIGIIFSALKEGAFKTWEKTKIPKTLMACPIKLFTVVVYMLVHSFYYSNLHKLTLIDVYFTSRHLCTGLRLASKCTHTKYYKVCIWEWQTR